MCIVVVAVAGGRRVGDSPRRLCSSHLLWQLTSNIHPAHLRSSSALCFCSRRFAANSLRSSSTLARSSGLPASAAYTHVCRPMLPFKLRSSG